MIEIVTDKDRNLKNLKQIGTPREEDKIYIENFAYAKIKEDSYKEKRIFVLMGHTERMQGKYATFVEAVIPVRDIEFAGHTPRWTNTIWNGIFREIKRLYEDMIIVGWALDMKGMLPKLTPELERQHREYFGGAHQLLFLLDTLEQEETFYMYKENHLIAKEGFYIYHHARRKETVESYPQEERQEKIPIQVREKAPQPMEQRISRESFRKLDRESANSPQVDVELDIPEGIGQKGRYRQLIQEKNAPKSKESGNAGLAVAIAMLVFVVGVGVYENRGEIFGTQGSVPTNLIQDKEDDMDEADTANTESESAASADKIPVEIVPGS